MTALRVDGADGSHHNQGPNLRAAKAAGLKFFYHKATEGSSVVDETYSVRRKLARGAGVPFGAYHFARPDKSLGDPKREAQFFLDHAKPQPGDLAPALDIETTGGLSPDSLWDWVVAFMRHIEENVPGMKLGVLYSPFFGERKHPWIRWVPRYNNDNRLPAGPTDIFQFSNGQLGTPRSFPGLPGRYDLNHLISDTSLRNLIITKPKVKPAPKKTRRLHLAHASLQFGLTNKQHTEDIEKIMSRGYDIITGTESGPGARNTASELVRIGGAHDYVMWVPHAQAKGTGRQTDTWLGVHKSLIKTAETIEKGYDQVIPGSAHLYDAAGLKPDLNPRWGPKGLTHMAFDAVDGIGRVNVGAAHYLTGGHHPGAIEHGVDHWEWNKALGEHIGEWAIEVGAGSDLVFFGADSNMVDAKNNKPEGDVFFGAPLTTAWDELGKWENTGHGNIDVIASYDADSRVSAHDIRALDDREFPLNTDHFLTEAEYDITLR